MTTAHIALGLICAFCFSESSVSVLGKAGRISDQILNRLSREVNAPYPIDCQLSSWSDWTECDPCTEKKFRSRRIENFGQYGGRKCLQPLGDVKTCRPLKPCEKQPIECGNDFECDSGRCIKKRLVCNEDNDCGDFSDEDCEEPKSPCRKHEGIEVSEVGRTAGNSINILGVETYSNPFNNEFYNGLCDRVYDGNRRIYYRRPWNLASLAYVSKGDKSITTETYNDAIKLVTEITREDRHTIEVGLSIKSVQTEGISANISASTGLKYDIKENLRNLKEYSQDKSKTFIKVKGQIQLGTFQIRSRDVMLTDTFLDALTALPVNYEKGEYFAFLETYGTHYAVSGDVGGTYSLVYVLDSNIMKTNDVTNKDVAECLGYNAKVDFGTAGISVSPKVQGEKCSNTGYKHTADPTKSGVIENIIPFVKGGTIDFNTKLNELMAKGHKVVDVDDYVSWASSLVHSPVAINERAAPIYNLVPLKMKDGYKKKENLERAIEDYLDEFHVCKCQPCQNGGTVTLVNGECLCQCSNYFEGIACQIRKSELLGEIPVVDGKWGCWSTWSACVNKNRSRTRQCNNPSPGAGGRACQGLSVETEDC